jgi:hypothetical protein
MLMLVDGDGLEIDRRDGELVHGRDTWGLQAASDTFHFELVRVKGNAQAPAT